MTIYKRWMALCLGLLMSISIAQANTPNLTPPQAVIERIGPVKLVGQARYTYWFWNVYDIALYAPNGRYQPNQPFALTIEYLRDFTGKSISDETIKQIQRQNNPPSDAVLEQWREQMNKIFPDVSRGDWIVGVSDGNNAYFYNKQGALLGTVEGKQFVQFFFDIWLGSNTLSQRLTHTLLGQ